MTSGISPSAGRPASPSLLIDVDKLVAAYFEEQPDPAVPAQRVSFGTSGHRGSAFTRTFNEAHIRAITQAICDFRREHKISGPLFIGRDTHALSKPAYETALECLSANGIDLLTDADDGYVPTPSVSHAILRYNRGRADGHADGIVVTPSHNPPDEGGFKYNPPHGGPAEEAVTTWIERRANEVLSQASGALARSAHGRSGSPGPYKFCDRYVEDLAAVIDMDAIAASRVRIGVDPLGGAGVRYWPAIAERYRLDLTVVNASVDPTFRFMTVDWDGKIRMDPSSPYAMRRLVALKDRFDVAVACDTDHDRHGVVARGSGLLPANHYLAACVEYLASTRAGWRQDAAVGKTVVTSAMLDRVARARSRKVYEVPVGFKWFVTRLLDGSVGFAGEESAGATFARRDGTVWTTDKDGISSALLAAEMLARSRHDAAQIYDRLTADFGECVYSRHDVHATPKEKEVLRRLSRQDVTVGSIAGERIETVLTEAPGDGQSIGGIKIATSSGWIAIRPSGTEDVYKLYAESFAGAAHLEQLETAARALVADVLGRGRGGNQEGR